MPPRKNIHHVCFDRVMFEREPLLNSWRTHPSMIVPEMDYTAHNKLLHWQMKGMPVPSLEMVGGVMDVISDEREFSLGGLKKVVSFFNDFARTTPSFVEASVADQMARHITQQMDYIPMNKLQAVREINSIRFQQYRTGHE